jgi:hypothetical protein
VPAKGAITERVATAASMTMSFRIVPSQSICREPSPLRDEGLSLDISVSDRRHLS